MGPHASEPVAFLTPFFFVGMKESNRRKFIKPPPLSDYDRLIKKSYDKRKSGSSSSGVPQLGA